jgi:signal transduction histidine kinase
MDELNLKITIVGLVGFAVLTLLVILFVITIIRNHRIKVNIERDQILKDIQLLEKERSRIAADLHDELGSLISAIKINLECLDTSENPENIAILEKTGNYIDTTMQKIREISNNLMPKILEQNGIIAAVTDFINMIDVKSKISIKFDHELIDESSIPEEYKPHLFRIIQELLNNAVKHAKATQILIQIVLKNQNLIMTIKDNGIGFDENIDITKIKSDGLRNIIRRAELINGKVILESQINIGTNYTIEIPLKNG